MMTKTPHISFPIDEARRRINTANHHVWRAGHQDTAYELSRAVDKLNESLRLVQKMQQDYPFANPAKIDTSIPAGDPRIAPPEMELPTQTTLSDCPPGLFLYGRELCFKSEYRSSLGIDVHAVVAYVVRTGETFMGGTSDFAAREELLVQPLKTPHVASLEPLDDEEDDLDGF